MTSIIDTIKEKITSFLNSKTSEVIDSAKNKIKDITPDELDGKVDEFAHSFKSRADEFIDTTIKK